MILYGDRDWWRAQLVSHLGNGKSLVRLEIGAKRYHEYEIPTETIPLDLREVGSHFLISCEQGLWTILPAPPQSN
jgi:hypothetical protein